MRKELKVLNIVLAIVLVVVAGVFTYQFIKIGQDSDLGPGIVVTPAPDNSDASGAADSASSDADSAMPSSTAPYVAGNNIASVIQTSVGTVTEDSEQGDLKSASDSVADAPRIELQESGR